MDLMEKNITLLSSDVRHNIAPINESDLSVRFLGQDQEKELFAGEDGQIYAIKHQLDKDNLPDATKVELIVLIGIAGVEEIKHLSQLANPKSLILIIEPNLAFLFDAISRKDLSFVQTGQFRILAQTLENLPSALTSIFGSELVMLVSNLRVYATYFYRTYGLTFYKKLVHILSTTIRYMLFVLGNSIEDSLVGLKNNLHNMIFMPQAKDVSRLKGAFTEMPAFIVSAGPSLEKNIHYLKKTKGRGIIFAVDTILDKLLAAEIIPDFVCTIERPDEIFDYFYKGRHIPESVALLAPPVVTPAIFANHQGTKVIPLRQGVREYFWLNDSVLKLDPDCFVSMGASVAHLAFGLAAHMGASPIVLVGQDLAYGGDGKRSHSSGTIYDEDSFGLENLPKIEVEGYYGGKVLTQKTWIDFKMWFESEIMRQDLLVINATEGGARIAGTTQMALGDVIESYCKQDINVQKVLSRCSQYELDLGKVQKHLASAAQDIKKILKQVENNKKQLQSIRLFAQMSEQKLLAALTKMKKMDAVLLQLYKHNLLFHVLQPYLISIFHRFYKIAGVLSYENVTANLELQREFLHVVAATMQMILDIFEEKIGFLQDNSSLEGELTRNVL